jgi:hypothetical protein
MMLKQVQSETSFISCLKATARDKERESIEINNEPLQVI